MANARDMFILLSLAAPCVARLLDHRTHVQPALVDVAVGNDASGLTEKAVLEQIRQYQAANPTFSEESCTKMFETKLKLGGPVPSEQFVKGCTEVCGLVKKVKDYWGSGKMADYACGHINDFGCVWETAERVAPVTGKEVCR
mmetsp:Transcript_124209/g.247478  ORF Transcript_124209/g.247478 Transcript_124209/m.247478 type:complete len:142 (-) Transcript_124209:189-614(-)